MAVSQAIPITRHPFANGAYKQMLIDGKWVDAASGKRFETRNPATGELLATVAEGAKEDIDRAVAAARRAFEGPWSKVKPFERQNLLLRLADLVEKNFDELSQLDTLDMGAPVSRTRAYRLRAIGMLRYYAGQTTAIHGETVENSLPGEIFSYTLKEPVGVVGAIIPWNGPLTATIWKIGPAIATGCTVVLKPAEEAPLTSLRIAELAMEAGVPAGVINVVPGYGETAGAALASHHDVDKVAFTGSHVTGQSIIRASAGNLKRVSLELGGKSPDIVFADADLDAAVPGAAMAVFANSGQICSAGTRLFVEQSIYEEFVGRVAEFGKKLQVGNGLDPNTQIGPLVSEQQLERVTGYLDIGQKEGARARSQHADRPAGLRAAARARHRLSRHRPEGRRPRPGRRWPRHRGCAVEGLLRLADGVRRRRGQHADRAGGDLRPGHLRDRLQGHGRAGQARQCHHVRPRLGPVDARRQ
jgi:aldehyde dehydrogenase (NAD+)